MSDSSSRIGDWVLYNNHQLAAFNKPAGLPVQPDRSGAKSLLELAELYCHQALHLIHRIDRPASGVVLMAKKTTSLADLNTQFQEREVEKTYLAIVGQLPPASTGQLTHYLRKDGRTNKTQVLDAPAPEAREASLRYTLLGSSERYHLLRVDLLTGRHHQIRAQLAHLGCPIRGDEKYGFRRANPDRSIDLHSWQLRFRHPVSAEMELITATPPSSPVWQAFADILANLT